MHEYENNILRIYVVKLTIKVTIAKFKVMFENSIRILCPKNGFF